MYISKSINERLSHRSAIREAFESATRLKGEIGAENVFDYSIGNPAAACPEGVVRAYKKSATTEAEDHGYMQSAGYVDVREKIAASLKSRFSTDYSAEDIIMTNGAACAINITLQSILDPGDEVITFLPSYPAYKSFIENWQGCMREIPYEIVGGGGRPFHA